MKSKKNEYADQIKQAVAILRDNNGRVTVKAISELTGIHIQTLYQQEETRKLVRVHSKRHKSKATIKPLAVEDEVHKDSLISLEQNVDSYMAHIRDNYFSHGEAVEDAKLYMLLEMADFKEDLFNQAINRLLLSKELKQYGHSPSLLIGNFNHSKHVGTVGIDTYTNHPVVSQEQNLDDTNILRNPQNDIEAWGSDVWVILNESTNVSEIVLGEAELKKRVNSILECSYVELSIFKLVSRAKNAPQFSYV